MPAPASPGGAASRGPLFARSGAWVVRRARVVLALAVVGLLISAALAVGAFGALKDGGRDDPASDSSRAQALLDQNFPGEPNMVFLVRARDGDVDAPAVAASGSALAARLAGESGVAGVMSYWDTGAPSLRSTDGADALILVTVAAGEEQGDRAGDLLEEYAEVDDEVATVAIGGSLGTDIGSQVGKDIARAEAIAVPVTLLLLLLAFGTAVAAVLPMAIGTLGIAGAFAVLFVFTRFTDVSVFAINITTALGLGLGIDYALLVVSRYREELARGASVSEAVVRTVATAGRTIAFSALAVATALAALLVFPVYFLRSFAYAGIAVTLISALAAIVVLPALLVVLGHRVNAGRLPLLRERGSESLVWGRIARAVMQRPLVTGLPVVAVLLFAASPLLGVTFSSPDDRVLAADHPAHQVGDALRSGYVSNAAGTTDLVLTPAPARAELADFTRALSVLPGVVGADSSVGSFADGEPAEPTSDPGALDGGGHAWITLSSDLDPASADAQDLVRQVRAQPAPPGSEVLVGGRTAELIDAKSAIAGSLPLAGAIIAVSTFVLLFLFTGSIVQPVRALVGNLLTLGATLGVAVWIFQEGHLSGLLGFTPTPTDTAMPVLVFCIAFGLSMDYEVFLMSRIKELHDAGASTAESVTVGLARSGRLVSTAAGLIAVSFFAFAVSEVSFIQLFGIAAGLAILLDATLVRGVLVPASFRLLGRSAWYAPALLRRFHHRFGLSDA
ncbi:MULTISPECIES: MMPL family transporter [unclassified Modestobacter]|uniref:MMPL family transporter n=1 Tax=unclassified Modestobacter TaxID=2643866 RepID=UPI0022AA15B7|nr:MULTISPECIES: MMPL family transporter [unclassified Modestobacter]